VLALATVLPNVGTVKGAMNAATKPTTVARRLNMYNNLLLRGGGTASDPVALQDKVKGCPRPCWRKSRKNRELR
jgi:hypothetical protein